MPAEDNLYAVRRNPLQLWHLLSLDAPTVAALWTWFVAHSKGIPLPFRAPAAMFLAVWILYAADRLLDAREGPPEALEERHHFHRRHRRAFLTGIAVAAIALAALTPELYPPALRLYALLGGLLAGYFLLIHTRVAGERRLPKELAVGIFFAAAIFIPTVARHPELRLHLLAPALLFGALCALNCMYLYAWEHPASLTEGPRVAAHSTTAFLTSHLTAAAMLITAASTLTAVFAHTLTLVYPIAVSAALLLGLDRFRARLSQLTLRASADLALLTPVLFLWFLR